MKETTATLDRSGRLLVPAPMRQALGAGAGTRLVLRLEEDGLHVQTATQALAEAQDLVGRYVSSDRSLSSELLAERRKEAEDE